MKTIKIVKKDGALPECSNSLGNGANWYICKLTGQRCPHQHWCVNVRHFEFIGSAQKCKNYKK